MKQIRYLLLLLMAIVTQGAWAQEGGINYVQELQAGDNNVNIPSFPSAYSYSTDRSAYNLYKFETPYTCEFGIYANGLASLDKAFAIFDENGDYVEYSVSTMGNGYSCPVTLEGHTTYYLGMRAKQANKSQQASYYVEFECAPHDHNYGEDGICTIEGCNEKEPVVLRPGMNTGIDCSYGSDRYLFETDVTGTLSLTATDSEGNESIIYFTLFDEDNNVIFTNYVASAPKRKAAGRKGCEVEAGKKYYFDFSKNDGTYNINIVVTPVCDHVIGEDGVCTECGEKVALVDDENTITFPAGFQTTAFKYTATQSKRLYVTVETDADILLYNIMPWSEWEKSSDNDDSPASVRRKVGASNMEPLMVKKVEEGNVYAIVFYTTADVETSAKITLSYSEYTEVKVGTNTVRIESTPYYDEADPESYNLFKFVAPATGTAHFYTTGDEDTSGKLFDSNMSFIKDCQDDIDNNNWNFKIDYEVTEGETYYIGARQYSGYSIDEYSLVIEIEGYTPPVELKPLELVTEENGEITELPFYVAIDAFIKENKEEFNQFINPETGDLYVQSVTYKRKSTTSRWGTVILPYVLESNDKVTYYKLSAVGDGEMTFMPVETVDPNTPTVYRFNNESDSYQYDASTTTPTTLVEPSDENMLETDVNGWMIIGFYEQMIYNKDNISDINSDEEMKVFLSRFRYISKDKFMTATKSLTMNPYRAMFMYTGQESSMAKSFVISIADDEVDGIQAIVTEDGIEEVEAIYDLNGRKQSKLGKGVNIIRTADGKTRKIIQK